MKKKIPLAILEILQPITDQNLDNIEPVKNDSVIFQLKDKDEISDFFFQVVRQELSNGYPGYIIEYKPRSKDDISIHKVWVKVEEINNYVLRWIELVASYNKIHTIYDDPILKSNQERFEKQFEIIDDDADTSSFNLDQQIYLDEYLTSVKDKIVLLKEGRNDEEKKELLLLENEVISIQKDLTKQTKKTIIKRLARLWGKAQKVGLDVIKEIFISVASEIAKKLITGS